MLAHAGLFPLNLPLFPLNFPQPLLAPQLTTLPVLWIIVISYNPPLIPSPSHKLR